MGGCVVITGAGGNVGAKLRAHLVARGGYDLRLLDIDSRGDPAIQQADLSVLDPAWSDRFEGADVVVHLAANGDAAAPWAALVGPNVDAVLNVYMAASRHRTPRVVFASSVWAMAGRPKDGALLTAGEPDPGGNAYGATKLFGERTAHAFWRSHRIATVVVRLGGCLPGDNPPAFAGDPWQEQCWISNRDTCRGIELAMTAETNGVTMVNLVSANPGARWSLYEAAAVLGYEPVDRGPDPVPASSVPIASPRPLRAALRRYLWPST
ncbi:MAG: NAD-dependent epimerase/dehydratase family protein [Caulobacteraceae bacterium]